MVSNNVESAEPDKKYCGSCRRLRSISDFRFENKAKGTRHRQCGHCRRERRQARQEREVRTTVRRGIHKIRRVETLEAMYHWLELLAYEVGGLKRLAEICGEMMTSKGIPISYRITLLRTMFHMGTVCEQTQRTASIVKSSNDLKRLPKERLVQWIRELRLEGYLSITDVDPSPGDWRGFDPF